MSRSTSSAAAFALAVSLASVATLAQAQSLDDAIASSHASFAQYIDTSPTPGVSVAVMLGDRRVWAEGFGLADVEHDVPVTPTTLFRAWSVSKPLTAAAAGLLHEQGRLDLDAPIQDYVPSFPEKGHPITARQLGGHRAGIPHYGPDDLANFVSYGSPLEALEKFKDRDLLFEPGTRTEYSSFGYNLLGAVVEAAAEKQFLEFMQSEIFSPLGMRHTRADRYREIIPNRSGFYGVSENGELAHAPFTDNSDLWPGGGFLSTPSDLVAFGAGLLRGDLLKPETVELLFTPMGTMESLGMDYGFGWYVIESPDPEVGRILMHPGGHYGGTAILVIWERRPMVVSIMANVSMTDSVFRDLFALSRQTGQGFMAVKDAEVSESPGGEPIQMR
ncbi:MAG: serine hydrolase domain-containing protein [Acidobacteriota bacterium]